MYITLWYVHVPRCVHIPRTDQNRPRYVQLAIAIDIEVHAQTEQTRAVGTCTYLGTF